MSRRAILCLLVVSFALLRAVATAGEERYCNGRPRVMQGIPMYPNGRPIQVGKLYFFPNGNPTKEEDGSLLYPSGAPFYKSKVKGKEKPRFLYPNGNTLFDGKTSFYPNGLILYQDGLFYDRKAKVIPEGPRTITVRWRDQHYTFDVVNGIPSQKVIQIKMRDLDVVTSFTLANGKITNVEAFCLGSNTPTPE